MMAHLILFIFMTTPAGVMQLRIALPMSTMEFCEEYLSTPEPFLSPAGVVVQGHCVNEPAAPLGKPS